MSKDEDPVIKKLKWLTYLAVAMLVIGVILLILNPTGATIQLGVVQMEQLFTWRN